MERLQSTIRDLRDLFMSLDGHVDVADVDGQPFQTHVRVKVKEQLSRQDLRIPVELTLVELMHEFDGFDQLEEDVRKEVVEEARSLLSRLEALIDTESAISEPRMTLPEPPPMIADVIREEEERERRRVLEEQQREQLEREAREFEEREREVQRRQARAAEEQRSRSGSRRRGRWAAATRAGA